MTAPGPGNDLLIFSETKNVLMFLKYEIRRPKNVLQIIKRD
jgi:hypothetical protein